MLTDTEAIVLRQVKTVNGRRMLLLFSQKYGKISVGSNLTESGKNKSALPQRPFSYGRYELFKGRESYNLNRGQVIKSYYGIGEDLDKYMAASYVLELTEKLLADELPQPALFRLLLEFLDALEKRGQLFSAPVFEHSYPHCWRCDMPLIYYARESWFVDMSAEPIFQRRRGRHDLRGLRAAADAEDRQRNIDLWHEF